MLIMPIASSSHLPLVTTHLMLIMPLTTSFPLLHITKACSSCPFISRHKSSHAHHAHYILVPFTSHRNSMLSLAITSSSHLPHVTSRLMLIMPITSPSHLPHVTTLLMLSIQGVPKKGTNWSAKTTVFEQKF